jgi:hypothetical protein
MNRYGYKAVCKECSKLPTCRMFCDYGFVKKENECFVCSCYDPCENVTCDSSSACVPKVVEKSPTNKYDFKGVCEAPPMACARQQLIDQQLFKDNLKVTPELNCDNAGNYKPLQCYNDLCRCSTVEGLTTMDFVELTLDKAKNVCYQNDKIVGLLKLNADISIIEPGQGTFFKQNMSAEIANLLDLSDSAITITTYKSGSIIMEFVATSVDYALIRRTEEKLKSLQGTDIHLKCLGTTYEADIQDFVRIDAVITPRTTVKPIDIDRRTLLLVTLVPILGTLFLVLLVVGLYFVCKMWKGDMSSLLTVSNSARNSVSFDSILEKSSKAGYENPSYDSAKVVPTGGSFSAGSTIA